MIERTSFPRTSASFRPQVVEDMVELVSQISEEGVEVVRFLTHA